MSTAPSALRKGYLRTPGIYSEEQVRGWRKVTDAVHSRGGVIFLQLMHCGRISHTSMPPGGAQPVAMTPIPPLLQTKALSCFQAIDLTL
ncbi:MAG: hypothetical protein ABI356_05045 [Steroidobacteraceae bacterium]